MKVLRTIQREGWLITTEDGGDLCVTRNEHALSDLSLNRAELELFIADLREAAKPDDVARQAPLHGLLCPRPTP